MYILTLRKSSSKNFEKGLALAERFTIIQNWSSTKASFRGREVDPYRFILSPHFLNDYARTSNRDAENCWVPCDCQGWGCKKLNHISILESGNGEYKSNNSYWYNFGRFNSKNEWIIDKPAKEKPLNFLKISGIYHRDTETRESLKK